jgi:hypothetical protein
VPLIATRIGLEESVPKQRLKSHYYGSKQGFFRVADAPSHLASSSYVMGSLFGGARSTGVLGAKLLGSDSYSIGLVGSVILIDLQVNGSCVECGGCERSDLIQHPKEIEW